MYFYNVTTLWTENVNITNAFFIFWNDFTNNSVQMCNFTKMEKFVELKPSRSNSYCLILGQISVSRPMWRMLVWSQHEL